jgi:hypothetical protein
MSTPDTTPVPRQKGRYSLFDTPDGGLHVAYTAEGTDETQHIEIPGRLLQMAKMLEDGKMSPMKAFSALRKMAGVNGE